jgi:hypothetical protein
VLFEAAEMERTRRARIRKRLVNEEDSRAILQCEEEDMEGSGRCSKMVKPKCTVR